MSAKKLIDWKKRALMADRLVKLYIQANSLESQYDCCIFTGPKQDRLLNELVKVSVKIGDLLQEYNKFKKNK